MQTDVACVRVTGLMQNIEFQYFIFYLFSVFIIFFIE